ncbi:hypothetical protein AB0D04_21265 [Streptomyces sp. NPDC048483]|uniref:hypothetical protein n=1 Tax=Streptomyces sp. NPDC048483 TaxID=3154927 RepID=UPI00343F5DF5
MSAAFRRPPATKAPGLRIRLPWWAVALPVVSFITLLALMASPSEASAAGASRSGLAALLDLLARLVGVGV